MSICQLCTGWGGHHDPVAHGEVQSEWEMVTDGICPRTGYRIMPDGILRPSCAICDCGEEEP